MKKIRFRKLLLWSIIIYVIYLISITLWYYSIYTHKTYLKDEFHVQSTSLNNFKTVNYYNGLLNIIKRNDANLYSLQYYKKDSTLVNLAMLYNSRAKKDIYSDTLEYGMGIYSFLINKNFKLNLTRNKLRNTDWYLFHSLRNTNLFSYEVKQKMGLKGNFKINSMEYYYEGEAIQQKDSLNGRLKKILIKPKNFEVGFNNDGKRMIHVESTEEKQPLSVTFYEKENILFLIFLGSAKNKITENSIDEFIVFD